MIKELAPSSRNSGMESILGWDPFPTLFNRRPIDRFFDGGFPFSLPFAGISDALESDFNVRIVDSEDSKEFKYALPGVSKDNINIEVVDEVLSVQVREKNENGERSYYSKVRLDPNLDLDKITAESKDGLLTVSIPIKEPSSRRIPVNIAEDRESLESGSLSVSQRNEKDKQDGSSDNTG